MTCISGTFQICTWSIDTWEKKTSFPLQLTTSESCSACTGDTRVQLRCDEIQFLVSHGTQLALYDAANVDRVQRVHDTTTYAKLCLISVSLAVDPSGCPFSTNYFCSILLQQHASLCLVL